MQNAARGHYSLESLLRLDFWLTKMQRATSDSDSPILPKRAVPSPLPSDQSEICTPAPLFWLFINQPAVVCYLVWAEGALDWESGHLCRKPLCPSVSQLTSLALKFFIYKIAIRKSAFLIGLY